MPGLRAEAPSRRSGAAWRGLRPTPRAGRGFRTRPPEPTGPDSSSPSNPALTRGRGETPLPAAAPRPLTAAARLGRTSGPGRRGTPEPASSSTDERPGRTAVSRFDGLATSSGCGICKPGAAAHRGKAREQPAPHHRQTQPGPSAQQRPRGNCGQGSPKREHLTPPSPAADGRPIPTPRSAWEPLVDHHHRPAPRSGRRASRGGAELERIDASKVHGDRPSRRGELMARAPDRPGGAARSCVAIDHRSRGSRLASIDSRARTRSRCATSCETRTTALLVRPRATSTLALSCLVPWTLAVSSPSLRGTPS